MDFFDHQQRAHKQTGLLLFLYVLAIAAVIASVYIVIALIAQVGMDRDASGLVQARVPLWDPGLFALVAGGTAALVGGGTMFKLAQLSAGGRVVAELLGGQLVSSETADPAVVRLLNVVAEMAIAAGTPVPPVYLLDETGINAFAAGFSPNHAVIGVTRGCVENLSRDELQGVIAHEFSHILNGDMRLNMRLIGLLFGVMLIGLIGWTILRLSLRGSVRLGARSDGKKGGNPLPLVGLALYIIGYAGVFCASLIKAAVSRQREFLADASAVQYTRNPDGLAGALKKIGRLSAGSQLRSPQAAEASHLFFSNAMPAGFTQLFGLLSTHPPLVTRIQRLDPSFDGDFGQISLSDVSDTPIVLPAPRDRPRPSITPTSRLVDAEPAATVDRVGTVPAGALPFAAEAVVAFTTPIESRLSDPYSVRAIVFALLIDADADLAATQVHSLAQLIEPDLLAETQALLPEIRQVPASLRLPLLQRTVPALLRLSADQGRQFLDQIAVVARADGKICLFDYAMQRHLWSRLARVIGRTRPLPVAHHSVAAVTRPTINLLTTLSWVGHRESAQAAHAFKIAVQSLNWGAASLGFDHQADAGLEVVDAALRELEQASFPLKRDVLRACVACVAADRRLNIEEAELLRVVADTLDCPMPPWVEEQITQGRIG